MILYRTWPYGTFRRGIVQDAIVVHQLDGPRTIGLIFVADGEPDQPYLLLGQGSFGRAAAGERGTITFTAGGATGGYWHYAPEVAL